MAFKGCIPLTKDQCQAILATMDKYDNALRNKALFTTQLYCGFRISEVLSLRKAAVWNEKAQCCNSILAVRRCNTKGKKEGRKVKMNAAAAEALKKWLQSDEGKTIPSNGPLFPSTTCVNSPLCYKQALRIYKRACTEAGIIGEAYDIGTHCARKTFAKHINDTTKDIRKVQKALGHKSIASTEHYLQFDQDDLNEAIMASW